MGLDAPKIYLDTCLVIYLVEEHDTFCEPVQRAIRQVANAEFCVSALVELECLVGPLRRHDAELIASYEGFLATATRLAIPDAVYRAAALLRANHGMKTPDALHLAIALHHGCDQLWTNDDRLARVSGGVAVNVLRLPQDT